MSKRKTYMTLDEIMDKLIAEISTWTPDQKAIARGKLNRELNTVPAGPKITYKM